MYEFIAAAAVLVLAGIFVRFAGSGGRQPFAKWNTPRHRWRCEGRIYLTRQHSIHVVDIEGERFVVGLHPGGITLLGNSRTAKHEENQVAGE